MAGDWIKLHRKLLDSELIGDHWLFTLWCWCLMKAQYKERLGLKAGQFITGRFIGSEQLHVSPSKFYRGLQKLQEMKMVKLKANSQKTIVTVCKWASYQQDDNGTPPKVNSEWTADEQPVDSERTASEQQMNTVQEGKKSIRKEGSPPNPPKGGNLDSALTEARKIRSSINRADPAGWQQKTSSASDPVASIVAGIGGWGKVLDMDDRDFSREFKGRWKSLFPGRRRCS